ncbi:MAG: LysR family transcriptional regulator [Burkholderiales bacterium]|nr:LysR family transcriptional regulator [Burkholderiales bacterium]
MTPDFQAMATFVEVVERGGFTAAARTLGIAKSMASRRVAQLESALGTRLLNRTTRGMALTEPGREFFARAQAALKSLHEACEQAAGRGGEVSGSLRITAPAALASALVVPVVSRLMAEHPRLGFEVLLEERRLDLLREGIDLAVRTGPLADSTLMARPLADIAGLAVASPAYLAAHGRPDSIEALAGHVLLDHAELVMGIGAWRFDTPQGLRVPGGERRLRINSFEALRDLAIDGHGIAPLPPFVATPAVQAGALQVVLPQYRLAAHRLYAVFPPARPLAAKLRVLIDALVQHAGGSAAAWRGEPA